MRLRKFDDHLHEKLCDPEYAIEFLTLAAEEGAEEFLRALKETLNALGSEASVQELLIRGIFY